MSTKLPSAFDHIRAHLNCTCSFCWAMWELIDGETMTPEMWEAYMVHLRDEHMWERGEWTFLESGIA